MNKWAYDSGRRQGAIDMLVFLGLPIEEAAQLEGRMNEDARDR